MTDSTSIIDATSDTTAIIIIDATSSDVQNFQATVAYGLVNDFNGFMGPLATKCDSLGGQMDSIRDQISGIGNNYTPGGVFNNGIANGLNEAYNSAKWAQGKEAIDMAKNVLDKCSFFKEMAPSVPKYGDPFKQIKSLAKSAAEKAEAAADAVIDKLKNSSGYQFLEAGIGKSIAAITNTGRTVYDKVLGAVEDVGEAISPVIEYGKSAVSQTQTALSSATKELGKMDKLIDCLNAVGGPDFSSQIDEMMDQMNCYYDKLGVFDDPLLPNFGEFDVDSYLSSIGTLDPQAATNIKKAINMYSKAKNNAQGSIAKATDIAKKAKSANDPSASSQPIGQKTEAVSTNSKATQTIPGIPGKTQTQTVDIPEPEALEPPPLPDPPVPPEPKVAYTTWLNESEVVMNLSSYDTYDPGHKHYNEYLSDGNASISKVEVYEPDEIPTIKMEVIISSATVGSATDTDWLGRQSWLLKIRTTTIIRLTNTKTGNFSARSVSTETSNAEWTRNHDDITDPDYITPLLIKAIRNSLQRTTFSNSDVSNSLR